MRPILTTILFAALCVSGCGKPAATSTYQDVAPKATAPDKTKLNPAAVAAALPMLAFAYEEDIQAPRVHLEALLDRHRAACQAAGPLQCQVTSAEFSRENGSAQGSLTLRAAPTWLSGFRAGLDQDAKGAGGGIVRSNVTTEDLTREITDADAIVKAKSALRDRLQALIASRPGKLSDLLDTERELARVQGEIDAIQSNLAVMRQRVDTSTLTIRYLSVGSGDNGLDMIGRALGNAGDVSEKTIAVLITIIAVLAPIAVLGGFIAWLAMWREKRRRLRNKPPASKDPPV